MILTDLYRFENCKKSCILEEDLRREACCLRSSWLQKNRKIKLEISYENKLYKLLADLYESKNKESCSLVERGACCLRSSRLEKRKTITFILIMILTDFGYL